jgi:hypothetical protein
MAGGNQWWRDLNPIHQGESDGQRMTWIYSRVLDGKTQYAVVTMSDGDGPDYVYDEIYLRDGKARKTP